jgi:hypothetical protein
MAFALLTVGVLMVASAVNNKQSVLVCLVQSDFTGPHSFIYWVIALLVIGAAGNIEKVKPLSDAFLFLIIVALFLAKGNAGFFGNFMQAIGSTAAAAGGSGVTGNPNQTTIRLPGGIQPL